MLIEDLQAQNEEYEGELYRDYWALYAGGHTFRKRIDRFLAKNELEANATYERRKKEACYRPYMGTVCDFFSALLFSTAPILKATLDGNADKEIEPPDWQPQIEDDCDGCGTDLYTFMERRLTEAMVTGCGMWRLDFPEMYGQGDSKSDVEKIGGLEVKLARVDRADVVDWERDTRGRLLWAIIEEPMSKPRPTPEDGKRGKKVYRWWVLTREKVDFYEVEVAKDDQLEKERNVSPKTTVQHNLGEVPLVELDVGPGLWIGNRLSDPQLEHFRLTSANNWSIRRTCYAMPVFSVTDPQSWRPPRMGTGYYLTLGLNETADWLSPPTAHISVTRDEIASQKDEIFRLVTQMSLGVDNNAAAVGRSGASKLADAEAIHVVLRSYGSLERDALKQTLNLLARARGDSSYTFSVEGFDKYETLPADVLIQLLGEALEMRIPSDTWLAEVKARAALALTPGLARSVKDKVRDEVIAGVAADDSRLHDAISALQKIPDDDDDDDEQRPKRGRGGQPRAKRAGKPPGFGGGSGGTAPAPPKDGGPA